MKVVAIELIWEGGWYCRLKCDDGTERDSPLSGSRRAGKQHLLPQARAEARAWGWKIKPDMTLTIKGPVC